MSASFVVKHSVGGGAVALDGGSVRPSLPSVPMGTQGWPSSG